MLAVLAPLGDDLPRRVLMIASYILLVAFAVANVRRPGLLIVGIGLLLNFLPVVSNGGLMPITPQTLERTGAVPQGVSPGDWVPDSKDVLLERNDTRLWFLSDRIVVQDLPGFRAFSIGDVVIALGLVVTVGDLFFPRFGPAHRGKPPAGDVA